MARSIISFSVPESIKHFIDNKTDAGGYGSVSGIPSRTDTGGSAS